MVYDTDIRNRTVVGRFRLDEDHVSHEACRDRDSCSRSRGGRIKKPFRALYGQRHNTRQQQEAYHQKFHFSLYEPEELGTRI